eukprot:13052056-Alexandrium_andersonii.AAC.1
MARPVLSVAVPGSEALQLVRRRVEERHTGVIRCLATKPCFGNCSHNVGGRLELLACSSWAQGIAPAIAAATPPVGSAAPALGQKPTDNPVARGVTQNGRIP